MTTPDGTLLPRRFVRHGMLPQLAAFQAVLQLGGVGRAAESLCIAQSTLSGHLRKLSDALEVELFELRGKRLVPTAAAWALLQTAHDVFQALDRCEHALAGLRRPGPARLTPP
jgi:DNA-binding transcriptional LysR family regulator